MATAKKKPTSRSKNTRTTSTAGKKSPTKKTTTSATKSTPKKIAKKASRLHPQLRSALHLLLALAVIIAIFPAIQLVIDYQSSRQHLSHAKEIPLPTAFEEDKAEALLYNTPDGRIMESNATGKGDKDAIIDFYTQSLTELGWTKNTNHNNKISARYIKDGERLDITITTSETGNNINYHLSPSPK